MTKIVGLQETVYGPLSDYLDKLEKSPLLGITLAEASRLDALVGFLRKFIPMVFHDFVHDFLFKQTLPVPSAPISSWNMLPKGTKGIVKVYTANGWGYISIEYLEEPETPEKFIAAEQSGYIDSTKFLTKRKVKTMNICQIVLAPDWKTDRELLSKPLGKKGKMKAIPVRKFVADLRLCAKQKGIGVLSFEGFLSKYEKVIRDSSFQEKWREYQKKLYLDFLKYFPMLAYSFCHGDYLSYRDNRNRAELDLSDGKYPESIVMNCRALEAALRIHFFMEKREEAPDKELGWLVQSLRNSIIRDMGEPYYSDLERVLTLRPYAAHTKREKRDSTDIEAIEANDRISIFCKMFFYLKWKVRI